MAKFVVITGASTGIGYAVAKDLHAQGYHVFGSVRKQSDADRLRTDFGETNFTPLLFDVTDYNAVRVAAEQVTQQLGDAGLAGLVNNAGIAVPGPILHTPVDEFRRQFEVNLFGLIEVTQSFLPLLGARKPCPHPPGRIVNISSVSGRMAMPFLGPYAASKHALEAISDSLRRELMLYGIDVISVQPGTIKTPIWDKAAQYDLSRFEKTDYYEVAKRMFNYAVEGGRNGQPVELVAKTVRHALESPNPRPHLTLPDGWIGWWLMRSLPSRWVDRLVAKRLGMNPR